MNKIDFDPPEGLQMPEGKMAGDTVELMAEFELKSDGRVCLVSIEGHDMPGYGDKGEASKDQGYPTSSKFAERYATAMNPNIQPDA